MSGGQSDVRRGETGRYEVTSAGGEQWDTPGSLLAQEVASLPEVRYVVERIEADRYQVVVVLDDDPEETLDGIFAAEAELYRRFQRMPFDVRVRKPGADWDSAGLLSDTLHHYERR